MTGGQELVTLVEGLTFAEAPRWRDGRLVFSDFYTYRVIAVDEAGRMETIANVPRQPSGLGWTPDGRLLVVSMLDHTLLRLDPSGLTVVADMSSLAKVSSNDMVVDSDGRAYVGNFGFDLHAGETPRSTRLARVDPDGAVTVAADGLIFPNGTVVTPDGRTLIVAETFANRLTAFDHARDGRLTNRRVFADLGENFPDGICLDAEGAVWVADPRHKKVFRVHEGGARSREITTGDRGAYACMLGGADRRTLFVCTNTQGGPEAAKALQGRIESAHVEVPGAGLP
jgi:sugar lactone lactonase YvrE